MNMKRLTLIIIFAAASIFGSRAAGEGSQLVHSPQVPILIDRTDNILFEIRINGHRGEVLNSLTVEFGEPTDMADIEALRLFYGGTEGKARKGMHFRPMNYIPNNQPGRTLAAHPSYSVLQSEAEKPRESVVLTSGQPLVEGVNYFWVSVQMSATTPTDAFVAAKVTGIEIDGKAVPVEQFGSTDARRVGIGVRHAGDDDVAAFRIPGLTTTRKGTLLGVYDVRRNNSADLQEAIDIGVSRSTDKGRTWEPMRIAMTFDGEGGLPQAQNGVGDPSILTDEVTGTIWIVAARTFGMGNLRAWTNSMPGMTADDTAQLMMVRSDDDGETWSEPINITGQVKDPSWHFLLQGPGRGITMKDGTLVFPIQFIAPDRIPHAGIMYSKDRGATWHINSPARSDTTEAQVAEIEDGVLMLNMRDNRGGSRAVAVTKDLGRTWTVHPSSRSALKEPICMASLLSVKAKDNVLGRDLLLFSNPNTTRGRHHITVKASLDGGLTWPERNQVLLDEEEGWGYSCLTLVDSETIGILYESSVAHMTYQTIKIKDLVKQQ